MSRRILLQAIFVESDTIRVVHEASDDVESFIWVLSYSVMRNLYGRASHRSASKEVKDQRSALRSTLNQAFGQTTSRNIANQRHSGAECLIFPKFFIVQNIIKSFMSDALKSLFDVLTELVHVQSSPRRPQALTHDALLTAVNRAIDSLPKEIK
jgi:hypothetical protein